MDLSCPAKGAVRLLWRSAPLVGFCVPPVSATDLPEPTRQVLKDLKLEESALVWVDQEFTVSHASRQSGARGAEKP